MIDWFDRLSSSPARSMLFVGTLSLLIGTGLTVAGGPWPRVHDEFSYLLASDTFANGRLTNPAHPLWVHFESFHIIHQPTYASKYPPAQGLTMALGQATFGRPIVGVWVATACASAAVSWMLLAWLPPRWAFIGGLMTALHPQVMKWEHSYWGGAVAMLGGALLLGGAQRVLTGSRRRDGAIMAAGVVLLANSRPFEGLVLSLLVLAWLLIWTRGHSAPPWRVTLRRTIAPFMIVFIPAAVWMGYYNFAVTGNPLRMPYLVHEETYAIIPTFGWQQPRQPPVYRHDVIRRLWVDGWDAPYRPRAVRTPTAPSVSSVRLWIRRFAVGMTTLANAYALNLGLVIALIGLPWTLRRDPWMRPVVAMLALGVFGILLGSWIQVHYAAPLIPLTLLISIGSLRRLSELRGGRIAVALALLFALAMGVRGYLWLLDRDTRGASDWFATRSRLAAALQSAPEKSLVVVRYRPEHHLLAEWVYNEADIDRARVVWAREMDPAHNRKLLEYFRDRKIWLLEADARRPKLVPYPVEQDAQ